MSDRDGEMTLAFSLVAVKRLVDPGEAFADARTWSRHLGVVSREPRGADRFTREHDLPQDFYTGARGKAESLALIRERFETERYVFVGTSESDRRLADSMAWEYRSIEEAAERAGWELVSPDRVLERARLRGLFHRIRRLVDGVR